jgi:hypothetical protein
VALPFIFQNANSTSHHLPRQNLIRISAKNLISAYFPLAFVGGTILGSHAYRGQIAVLEKIEQSDRKESICSGYGKFISSVIS